MQHGSALYPCLELPTGDSPFSVQVWHCFLVTGNLDPKSLWYKLAQLPYTVVAIYPRQNVVPSPFLILFRT